MSWARDSYQRFATSSRRGAARLWSALDAPLHWPRLTTRRLMILIAIIAVGFWAADAVPWMIDRVDLFQRHADYEGELAVAMRERAKASLERASRFDDKLTACRAALGSDPLTEGYLLSHREFEKTNAQHLFAMADRHDVIRRNYLRALWMPWVSRVAIPPALVDPLSAPDGDPRKRGYFEPIEGGLTVVFAPKGRVLAVGCRGGYVQLLELPSRRPLGRFNLPADGSLHVELSASGSTLLGVGGEKLVRLWDVATGRVLRDFSYGEQVPGSAAAETSETVTATALSPDGKAVAIAAGKSQGRHNWIQSLALFDVSSGAPRWVHKMTPGRWIYSVAFSPDGRSLALGDGGATLLDGETGRVKTSFKPGSGVILRVALSPDGKVLAGAGTGEGSASGGRGRVTLWDIESGAVMHTLEGPAGRDLAVDFSPDGQTVAAGGDGPQRKDGRNAHSGLRTSRESSEMRLWSVASGEPIWTVRGDATPVFSLAFAPDGETLAYCNPDYVYLVDVRTGELRRIVMETTGQWRVPQPRRAGTH